MREGIFDWKPELHTQEENNRWVFLRSVEWESFPNFLSPIWGIFAVYLYGWVSFLIILIVITFIWRVFLVKSFLSIGLMSGSAIIVNMLKWPLAVIMAVIAYFNHFGLLFSASLLLFPLITYFLSFLEMPYSIGGVSKLGKRAGALQKRIYMKLGYTFDEN